MERGKDSYVSSLPELSQGNLHKDYRDSNDEKSQNVWDKECSTSIALGISWESPNVPLNMWKKRDRESEESVM